MSNEKDKKQLVVIGAGPGGYGAAFTAADLGLKVTLIDKEKNPGGVCLYRGCIPAKSLLHITRLLVETKRCADWGVRFAEPEIDVDKIRKWKNSVVTRLTGGLGQLCKQRKIEYVQGTARFLGDNCLEIDKKGGKTETMSFEQAIIATGSTSARLPNLPEDSQHIMYSDRSLELETIPGSMLVVGGGYIGLEQADTYARLGTKVTVAEMTPQLMPGTDPELVAVLHGELKDRFHSILLQTKVTDIKHQKNGLRVVLQSEQEGQQERRFDRMLVAIGRRPHTKDLGLDQTAVELNDRGFIQTDQRCRTADPAIFAVGDVSCEPLLAHKATYEGRVAANVAADKDMVYEPRVVPFVEYTSPEMAACGLSEPEAKERDIPYEVAKFPWQASGRAATLGHSTGLTKLLIDPDSRRILGAGIVGPDAGELIPELALAIEMAAVATDLAWTIHPHPSLSETVMEAAALSLNECIHYRSKRTGKDKPPKK